jgi:hypothetical protein
MPFPTRPIFPSFFWINKQNLVAREFTDRTRAFIFLAYLIGPLLFSPFLLSLFASPKWHLIRQNDPNGGERVKGHWKRRSLRMRWQMPSEAFGVRIYYFFKRSYNNHKQNSSVYSNRNEFYSSTFSQRYPTGYLQANLLRANSLQQFCISRLFMVGLN